MKRIFSILVSLIISFTIAPKDALAHTDSNDSFMLVDLIAGQHDKVGNIIVWNDTDYIYIKYKTVNDYCMPETHLQIASSLEEIPQKNGNPIPGQFEYQESHGCVSKYTYTIPLTKNSCDLYVAAHAMVKKSKYLKNMYGYHHSSTETAWGNGFDFPGENWATYFIYTIAKCNDTQNPRLSLTKTADPLAYDAVGQLISYSYVIENTGNVTLTGPFSVVDDKTPVSCEQPASGMLSPGETLNCSASYSITQADLDTGSVTNKASASGGGVTSPEVMETITAFVPNPSLSFTKVSVLDMEVIEPNDQADVGDVINYTLTATNDGNVNLTNVIITDPQLGTLSCTPAQPTELAPNESVICTGNYTLNQVDIDSGVVENTATATSDQVSSVNASRITPILQPNPHLNLIKSTTTTSYDQVGQAIDYTLMAINDGNAILTDVSISDPLVGILTCTQPVTLAPGETLSCTGSYVVTQADLDAGSILNTATVSGIDPDNHLVTGETSQTIAASNVCQPTVITADFSQIPVGGSVEGTGTVAPYLDIDAKGTAVKILDATLPKAYGAPNDENNNPPLNGGLVAGGGFTDISTAEAKQAHQYTFTFTGVTVSNFSLRMLDNGDWNPYRTLEHSVSLTAYDGNGTVVAQQDINYTTEAVALPRSSSLYGDLWFTGDAVTASPGQLGNWTWDISGTGIAKVVLNFGVGFDPNIGFDTLNFTLDCP